MLTSGSRLAHYEVVARVGAGGQGEVYRARDARLKRDVALKALPPDAVGDPERRKRLELEAELLAKLNHPGIATIHGVEDAEGSTYLIMELIDGETLAERIARRPLSPEEARSLFHGIADALEAAHEQGVIHQNLKPSNVMIRRDGKPKLLDFGLGTKTFQPEPGPEATTVDQPAPAGRAVGTPRYMSPEQVRGQPVDARTDVWAFGCCLFESLTGMPAFEGETVAAISSAILERERTGSACRNGCRRISRGFCVAVS